MRRVFVLVVALVAVLSCCGTPTSDTEISTAAAPFLTSSSEVDTTAQPTPSTRYIPATTMPPATSTATSTTMTPTTASDATSELVFLVAGPDGVALHSIDGVESLVPDRRARVAFPDGHGGVVFQDGEGGIWWMASLDEVPVMLGSTDRLLQGAGSLDGEPVALYTVGAQCSEEELFEGACYLAELRIRHLKNSDDDLVLSYGTWEGGLVSASLGGRTVAVSMGEPIESVFIYFYSLDGSEHAFAHVGGSELAVLIPSEARPDAEHSCFVGGLSPNGSVLAYAGTSDSCFGPPSSAQPPFEVTVVDLATGEELLRVDLGNRGEALWQIPQVDFDGGRIFVSQMGVPPMLLTLDGSIQEVTWLPTWLWQLEVVDSGDDCPYWGFADAGGQVYCIPPGEAVLWNAG